MRDFSAFHTRDLNSKLISSGKRTYERQLKRVEATEILINGVEVRGIVYNDINVYTDNEYRTVTVPLEVEFKNGDYVKYMEEDYLNTNDVDYHYVYKSAKVTKCNQKIKWPGLPDEWVEGFPCIMSNDSYGSKQSRTNDLISEIDTKMKIIVQKNEWTKQIRRDMRFMFANSEFDIFRVTDITWSVKSGLITLIAAKDTLRLEDDLDNNLAFNEPRIHKVPEETKEYTIDGEESVRVGKSYEYTINPKLENGVTVSVDDTDIAEITATTDTTCTVLIKMKDEVFTLNIVDAGGETIASKIIYTTK